MKYYHYIIENIKTGERSGIIVKNKRPQNGGKNKMKISYNLRWNPATGTAYRQTVRITAAENNALFSGQFSPGVNYGNAYTGNYIASCIYNRPEYAEQLKRIIVSNTVVFVGTGKIPVYGEV